jgi:hypothetical protein
MLQHTLLVKDGMLVLEASGPFEIRDFEAIMEDVQPYLDTHKSLAGVMIFARAFPGWLNLEAATGLLHHIERLYPQIERLAIVSDNGLLSRMPTFDDHRLNPDVKHFSESDYEEALSWLGSKDSQGANRFVQAEHVSGQS